MLTGWNHQSPFIEIGLPFNVYYCEFMFLMFVSFLVFWLHLLFFWIWCETHCLVFLLHVFVFAFVFCCAWFKCQCTHAYASQLEYLSWNLLKVFETDGLIARQSDKQIDILTDVKTNRDTYFQTNYISFEWQCVFF